MAAGLFSSGNVEVGAQVPLAKEVFSHLPLLDHLFTFHLGKQSIASPRKTEDGVKGLDLLDLRFRTDANVALHTIQSGYSKEIAYLKSTRQFEINLKWLQKQVVPFLVKVGTSP